MKRLVLEGWFLLLYVDWLMHIWGFECLHAVVRDQRVRQMGPGTESQTTFCHAVDVASVFYFKPVLCLQRSAATAMFLKRRGVKAELVIGVQMLPFQSHAWVEVDEIVVNDKPYVTEIFQVLERC
jgi:Transglutaminase-like superfamily